MEIMKTKKQMFTFAHYYFAPYFYYCILLTAYYENS